MRACFSSLLLGLFALQRSLGSASTAGLGLNAHSHNRTRLPVGPVLSTHAHNRTRLSVGSVVNAHAQNRTKLHDGGKDPHHRPKRGWVWNQFYVLEEHIGPEPQYVGKEHATSGDQECRRMFQSLHQHHIIQILSNSRSCRLWTNLLDIHHKRRLM